VTAPDILQLITDAWSLSTAKFAAKYGDEDEEEVEVLLDDVMDVQDGTLSREDFLAKYGPLAGFLFNGVVQAVGNPVHRERWEVPASFASHDSTNGPSERVHSEDVIHEGPTS